MAKKRNPAPALNQSLSDAGYSIYRDGNRWGIRDPNGGTYSGAGARQQQSIIDAMSVAAPGGNKGASGQSGGAGQGGQMAPNTGGGPRAPGGGNGPITTPGFVDGPRIGPPLTGGNGGGPGSSGGWGGYPGFSVNQGSGDIYGMATGGTINQFDTAANRLRERIDSQTRGAAQAARDSNLGRGFGASGINDAAMSRINSEGTNAYGQGLASLADMFEKNRLSGLDIGLRARGLDTQNANFMDGQMFGWYNNEADRDSRERMQSQQNRWQGGQNQNSLDAQQILAQLEEQNANWRASFGMGSNAMPTSQPYYGSGPSIYDTLAGRSYGNSSGSSFGRTF